MDDSTAAAEEMRSRRKRARLTSSAGGDDGADVDLISSLNDDVLLHVLSLVGDARDAVRTGALSRRWLGLWKGVPALTFASRSVWEPTDVQEWAALTRFVSSSVNNTLVLRRSQSGCSSIESLAISYTTYSPGTDDPEHNKNNAMPPPPSVDVYHNNVVGYTDPLGERYLERLLMPASVDAVQGWIWYAFRHGVKCFSVDMRLPYFWSGSGYGGCCRRWEEIVAGNGENKPAVLLDVLDDAIRPVGLEAMRLALGGARLRLLPTTAMEFTSLVDLLLEWIRLEAGSGHLLSRLLSPARCPRLRKLRMRKLCLDAAFNEKLLLETDVLSELRIQDVKFLSMELRTPSLKVLHLHQPWHQPFAVSAPRLEEIEMSFPQGYPRGWLRVDGDLPCVRSLKICMRSHRSPSGCDGEPEAEIDTNVQLLERCSSLTCLDVTLTGPEPFEGPFEGCDDVDIIKSRVPHLPHISFLSVNISLSLGHYGCGASVANLLTRFNNLRRLSLHFPSFKILDHKPTTRLDLLCDHRYHWKYSKFSMAHLQEVELTGLIGTDCELWFMKAVLTRAKRLHKVAVSFNPNCWHHESNMDAFECTLLDEGMWTSHRDAFTLTCFKCGLV